MRRFILAGIGAKASPTGVIASGVEWESGGICSIYWPKTGVSSNYPSMKYFQSENETENNKIIWADSNHIPINAVDNAERIQEELWIN